MAIQVLSRSAALAAVIALAGCGQPATPPPATQQQAQQQQPVEPEESQSAVPNQPRGEAILTLGASDDGRAVRLGRGDVVEIKLEADRVNGYTWIPAHNALPFMSTDGVPVYEIDEQAGASAPGLETWRFIGREPGHAHLVFEYRRPFEPDAPPQKTLTFHFDVE
jgi:inhibitor of cysteine peptidase